MGQLINRKEIPDYKPSFVGKGKTDWEQEIELALANPDKTIQIEKSYASYMAAYGSAKKARQHPDINYIVKRDQEGKFQVFIAAKTELAS